MKGDRSPSSLYVYDLKSGKVTKLVDGANPEMLLWIWWRLPSSATSRSTEKIPALLYKLKQASISKKLPALVEVHGGPGGQSRKGYMRISVFGKSRLCNFASQQPRQSGYGKTF